MLPKISKHHALPVILFILAATVISGSRYLGDYSSMGYIAIGIFFYLAIKAFSDFRYANKAVYIRVDGYHQTQSAIKFDREAILNGIKETKINNDNRFVIKNLPISVEELSNTLLSKAGEMDYQNFKDDLDRALYKMGFHIANGFILSGTGSGEDLAARILYDSALMEGLYEVRGKKKEFLKQNNVLIGAPTREKLLKALKLKDKILLASLQDREFEYNEIGGLLLFLWLNKKLSVLNA